MRSDRSDPNPVRRSRPSFGRGPATILLAAIAGGCAGPSPRSAYEEEIIRLSAAARMEYDQGRAREASDLYLKARELARSADDGARVAAAAYGAGVCLLTTGDHDRADSLLEEARAELKRLGRPATEILLVQAASARNRGAVERAAELAEEAWRAATSGGGPAERIQTHLLRAKIYRDLGNLAEARRELERARDELPFLRDPFLEAQALDVEGELLIADDRPAEAAAAFDREAELLRRNGHWRHMGLALGRSGAAYALAGARDEAYDRAFRGARSLFSQGYLEDASRAVEPLLPQPEEAAGDEKAERLVALYRSIVRAAEAARRKQGEAPREEGGGDER